MNKHWISHVGDALSCVNAVGDLLGLFRGVVLPLCGRGVALFSKARPRRLRKAAKGSRREGACVFDPMGPAPSSPPALLVPGREFPSARQVPVETGAPSLGGQPSRLRAICPGEASCAVWLTSYRGQRSGFAVGKVSQAHLYYEVQRPTPTRHCGVFGMLRGARRVAGLLRART